MEILKLIAMVFIGLLLLVGVVFLTAVLKALSEVMNEENEINNKD